MTYDDKIKQLNIILPKAADPVGSYVATKITGKLLFISGQISMNEKGELMLATEYGEELIVGGEVAASLRKLSGSKSCDT